MKPQFNALKSFIRLVSILFVISCLGTSSAARAQSDVTPTAFPTDTPTDTPTEAPSDTPLPTDTPTELPSPTPQPTSTSVDTATPTDTPTLSATPTETATPTVRVTETATPTDTPAEPAAPLQTLGLPFYDSFNSEAGWTASGSWTFDTLTAYSGGGWYAETMTRNLTSTLEFGGQIALNAANPQLTFWQQAHLSGADAVAVEISLNGGATWVTIDQQTAPLATWQSRIVNLTAFAGQTIRLRFRVTTPGDMPAGEMSNGYWLDEVTIQAAGPTPTPTVTLPPTSTPTATFTDTPAPTSAPVRLSYAPSDDAEVKSAYPTKNYGLNATLRVRTSSSDIHLSYLKFNVTGIGGAVQRAVLWLYVFDPSPDGGSLYLTSNTYRNSATPWTQSGITWNNAPGLAGLPLGSAGPVLTGAWISFDVTAAIPGNGVYSFVLTSNSSNSALYNSREATVNQPRLEIETGSESLSNTSAPTSTPTAVPSATSTVAAPATPTVLPTATPTVAPTATPTLLPTPTSMPMSMTSAQIPPDCSGYPEPRTFLESQAWWWIRKADQTGDDFGHIHLGTCFPHAQTVSGNVEFDVRIIMHHNPGYIHHVAAGIADDGPSLCYGGSMACVDLSKQPLACPMDQTCTWWVHLTVPTQLVPMDGRKEFRFRVFQGQPDGNRLFESTGWQAYLNNGHTVSNYRSMDSVEARGWYTEASYQNARLDTYPGNLKTLDGVVSGIWTPGVVMKPGAGGQPTDHYIAMIDPDFHSHMPSEGFVIAQGQGQFSGKLTIDTRPLANGWHRLVLRTDDDFLSVSGECAQNKGGTCDSTLSGVLVVWFNVQN